MAATAVAGECAAVAYSQTSAGVQPNPSISPAILAFADRLEPFPYPKPGEEPLTKADFNRIHDERAIRAEISGAKNMAEALDLVQHFRMGNFSPGNVRRFKELTGPAMEHELHGKPHHFYRAEDMLYFLDVEQPLKNAMLREIWPEESHEKRRQYPQGEIRPGLITVRRPNPLKDMEE